MSFAITAAVAGVAVAGAGIGLSASGAMNPTYGTTNVASSSRELSNAQANLLPIQRALAAAAQTGGDYTFQLPPGVNAADYGFNNLPGGTSQNTNTTEVFIPGAPDLTAISKKLGVPVQTLQQLSPTQLQARAQLAGISTQAGGQWVPYNAADFQSGGQYASLGKPQLRQITNNNGKYTVSFKGYGAGDTQSTIAKQSAADQLALAQKYDPQFIASALAQEKEADPYGTQARAMEADLIQKQSGENFVNPISDTLSKQVDQQVNAGKNLDPMEDQALQSALSDAQSARGSGGAGATAGTNFEQPLTSGAAGIARQQAGQQKAISELGSGTTPEDIQYRQQQQTMADLSALMSGQTPTSEFKSLSGAQSGPTPTVSGTALPTSAGGVTQTAQSSILSQNATGNQIRSSTANPWLAGLTTAINGVGALGNAGVF